MKMDMIRHNSHRDSSLEDAASRITTHRKNAKGMLEIAITERRQIRRKVMGVAGGASREKRDTTLKHFVSGIPESYLRNSPGGSGPVREKNDGSSKQAIPLPGKNGRRQPENNAIRTSASESPSPEEELAKVVSQKMGEVHAALLPDVRDLISPRQGELFIRKLFHNNAEIFQNFMNMLAHVNNWPDASRLIDEFFYQHGIDPYCREALELTNVVYTRYFPKERSLYPEAKFKS